MTVSRSTAVLAFLFGSILTIADSSFHDISANSAIIGGEHVNITLVRVSIKNAFSPLGLSKFNEESQLTITESTFENYHSSGDEAIYYNTGSLYITNSTFREFNTKFIQAGSCSVYITNSVFQEGGKDPFSRASDSAYGGALGCMDCTSVVVEHSSFLNVSTIFGGAIAVRSSSELNSVKAFIRNSEFVRCSASAGGAIYMKQSSVTVENSTFILNEAVWTGGAIDIYTSIEKDIVIRRCAFYRNSANAGGAVKWNDAEVTIIQATFQDNSAVYGPDIASYGVKLAGSITSSNGTVASGYPLQLIFELQDHYGQVVTTASAQDFQLLSSDLVNFRGNTASTANHGIFNFTGLVIYASPSSQQQITGIMSFYHNNKNTNITGSVEVTFRSCVPGEVSKVDRCEYCFAGNVSFTPSDSSCKFCPAHTNCPGGNELIADSHYWRGSVNSTDLYRCPLKENCLGGQHSECAKGYTGLACNECSEGYTRWRTLDCEPCRSHFLQWGKIALITVPILGFNAAVKTALGSRLCILKIFLNHAQLLSVLSYVRVTYPTVIKYSLHSLSYVSSLFITDLPLSCFNIYTSEYIKAIIGSVMPPALYSVLILLNINNKKKAWIACTSAMMFAPFISLSSQVPLLACQSVQTDDEFLFVDMKEKCWEGDHLLLVKALLVPSVILNVILPVIIVAVVASTSPANFNELFPLWQSGAKCRCWDLLAYCCKAILVCFTIVSISANELSQVAYGLVVLIIVSITVAGLSDYVYYSWKWFFLSESSLVIVAASLGLCTYFIYLSPTEGATDWLVTALFLVLNVGYFTLCVILWKFPPKMRDSRVEEVSPSGVTVPHNSFADVSSGNQVRQ